MSGYCDVCRYQEEFCRCPARPRDVILLVSIFVVAVATAIAFWWQSVPIEMP